MVSDERLKARTLKREQIFVLLKGLRHKRLEKGEMLSDERLNTRTHERKRIFMTLKDLSHKLCKDE